MGSLITHQYTTNVAILTGLSGSILVEFVSIAATQPLVTCNLRPERSVNAVNGHSFFSHIFSEVPSAPSIVEVRAFSTTAQIQFEEPESTGGVPVLKYRAQWRVQGRGSWDQGVYDIQQGQIKAGVMLFRGNIHLHKFMCPLLKQSGISAVMEQAPSTR